MKGVRSTFFKLSNECIQLVTHFSKSRVELKWSNRNQNVHNTYRVWILDRQSNQFMCLLFSQFTFKRNYTCIRTNSTTKISTNNLTMILVMITNKSNQQVAMIGYVHIQCDCCCITLWKLTRAPWTSVSLTVRIVINWIVIIANKISIHYSSFWLYWYKLHISLISILLFRSNSME